MNEVGSQKRKKKANRRKTILIVVIAVVAVIAMICGILAFLLWKNAGISYDEVREIAEIKETDDQSADNGEGGDLPENPIDFEALWKINPEAYAWITIPDTEVDYPIMRSETDNAFYLTHTVEGKPGSEGCIYTEDYNDMDFEDSNTLIYGHNMRNGSMFGGLQEYQDKGYFDSHRDIFIYTPDAIRKYRIFAAYLSDDRHILLSYDFDDQRVYQGYLNDIFNMRDMNACVDTDIDVGVDDKIITLSTCYGSQNDRRFLVQAVLVSIENTK